MKRLIATLAILICSLGPAHSANEPSWNTLERQFREMPMEARRLTGPLFWLHGDANETKERLELYLGKIAEGDNGSFCAESRPHSDWLGPRWFDDLDICLQAAKKLDLKMWIFDEKWWPSQTVDGKVPPEYAAKKLEASASVVDGPTHVSQTGFDDHFVSAIAGKLIGDAVDPNSLVDLKPFIKDGTLNWDAPEGKWQIMKFTWTQAPHAIQRPQLIVDGASKDCVDWFLRTVYQPHYDRFKDDFGKTIVGFFYDEPETQGDWGTELSATFAERGIDENTALVAWKFKLAGEEQVAARYAYIDALGETWGRTMYGGMTKWCEERGVASIGHFMEHSGLYIKPGLGALNLFQMQKYSSMGGMDLVVQQLWPGERRDGIYQLPKLTSSISHAYGKKDDLAMTEIFGAYGQGITYPQMKWLADWHQVRGVNFMIPHSMNPKAPNDTDCPPYFYADDAEPRWPLYRVWSDYTNRLSLMLTGGKHVCPIAFLFCGESTYVGKAVTPEDMTTTIQDALYDCDWIPYEVFEKDMIVNGGWLALRDEAYRVLIVPPVEVIPCQTMLKVKQFFDSGGTVIGYDFLPSKSATLGRAVEPLAYTIWGSGEPSLDVKRTNDMGGRSYLLPANVTPEQLTEVLSLGRHERLYAERDPGVWPEIEVLGGNTDGWLHVLHRVKSGVDVYLVCNQQHEGKAKRFTLCAAPISALFTFRERYVLPVPERWDPMRNEITSIPYSSETDGLIKFDLTLEPMESVLIVFNTDGKASRPEVITSQETKLVVPVTRTNAGGPEVRDSSQDLFGCPWVWYPEGDPRDNAPPGTRWFRTEIEIPEGRTITQGRFLISADNEFVLYVNGKRAGVSIAGGESWKTPRDLQIKRLLRPGANILAIAATNGGDEPNPAGLIGRYWIGLDQGSPIEGRIDRTWRCSKLEVKGWNAVGFDDKGWQPAKEIAKYGDAPWGIVSQRISPADPFVGRCTVGSKVDLKRSRVYLEMDGVREGASVKVNGIFAGGVIGKPFRLEVSKLLRHGANTIEIEPYAPTSVRLAIY